MQITFQWMLGGVSRVKCDQGDYIEHVRYRADELATLMRADAADWSEQFDKV